MSIFVRSLLVLALLFGMVFGVGIGVLHHYNFPLIVAVIYAAVVVLLQYALAPVVIDWIYDIQWCDPADISYEFASYLNALCHKASIPVPKFGVIRDGNPNAFTYGHIPGDARLVITQGLHDILTEEEFKAVVAHEVGHIRHYDFIVMTLASLAPLILYRLYKWSLGGRRSSTSSIIVGLCAYVAYVVSQYLVLFLSRLREYFADQHASYSVSDPNAIATALIKIGYGLARIPQAPAQGQPQNQPGQPVASSVASTSAQADSDPFAFLNDVLQSRHFGINRALQVQEDFSLAKLPKLLQSQCLCSLGICSFASSATMALYSTTPQGQFSIQYMLNAMQWDLWNPWARWFELHSTHPLIARRVQVAMDVARRLGHKPIIPASTPPTENLLPLFFSDALIMSLPSIAASVAIIVGIASLLHINNWNELENPFLTGMRCFKAVPLFVGIGWLLKLMFSYSSNYTPKRIADLLGRIDVSPLRCVPVEIEGTIIGRGIPGIAWSSDLVIQDNTGFTTLIYRQPLGILELLFGLFSVDHLIGQRVKIRGWYRRGPGPYIELNELYTVHGSVYRCYFPIFCWIMAVLCTVGGIVALTL